MSFEKPKQDVPGERVRAVAAEYVGDRGFELLFSDGTKSWVDREGREVWERQHNIPEAERLANLPSPAKEN
jgi:hypothetical protein